MNAPATLHSIQQQDMTLAQLIQGGEQLVGDLVDLCASEGILTLVEDVSAPLQPAIRQHVHQAVAAELAQKRVMANLLAALAAADIDVLVIKGTGLAYSIYDKPWQRTRSDTDLLVRESDRRRAMAVLYQQGFYLAEPAIGTVGNCEESFYLDSDSGQLCVDLHWRLTNHWILATPFSFDDLWRDRVQVPALSSAAHRCSDVWSLMIACVHREVHRRYLAYESKGLRRYESDFTLWIYDIHLLANRLEENDWQQLVRLAIARGFGHIVAEGLSRSRSLFDSPVQPSVIDGLRGARRQLAPELFDSAWQLEWKNFLAVPWAQKAALIVERLFPSRAHMNARYGTHDPLLVRYVARWHRGVRRRLGAVTNH